MHILVKFICWKIRDLNLILREICEIFSNLSFILFPFHFILKLLLYCRLIFCKSFLGEGLDHDLSYVEPIIWCVTHSPRIKFLHAIVRCKEFFKHAAFQPESGREGSGVMLQISYSWIEIFFFDSILSDLKPIGIIQYSHPSLFTTIAFYEYGAISI